MPKATQLQKIYYPVLDNNFINSFALMFKKNNFILGLIIGTIFPALSWGMFYCWHRDWVLMNKPIVPHLVAVFINLLLLRTFHKNNAQNTAKGIMLITFLFLIAVFLLKVKV